MPLISSNNTLGVISLFGIDKNHDDPKGLFLSMGVDVLVHISSLAALAIENAIIHSQLKHLADEEKEKLDVIGTINSRISAILDSITNGIIAVDENGILEIDGVECDGFAPVPGRLGAAALAERIVDRLGLDDQGLQFLELLAAMRLHGRRDDRLRLVGILFCQVAGADKAGREYASQRQADGGLHFDLPC